ncbi:hypothetical protein TPHA_0G03560 [Tetrapisispora phaffii CBS 4417]|uniref:Formate/nitrite transporter n=1 Tax=Tetrapisispora phaffii (strain ATCC 24235 / CBS 4417 / NBRC 1672 / NRRL Y-8282 / UCD 70-5) TaxID=1071381 RepID=G8BWB8_TETPH|nr:hypothetical protein TPHA_0G03560 [Tetrapisispora phaffii CBS 4417]CCE64196.1 hypothetical protein TPHA_0G03560 [Tetrapisispora phaffii CBS 4417]
MSDDTNYLSPHEAALAIVATAMKKARLTIDVLIINSILGGIFFSCGGLLLLAAHADNPVLFSENPGIPNMFSGFTFAIALYYVIITGVDLFNSNILYFSVALLRRAVTIYDLLISWFVSLLGNIAGSLFVSYLFGFLSGIGKQTEWRSASRKIAEQKLSFSFIETFLKAIAGNFLVCLAVYLQIMAKPIHVKFIVLVLPIYTFITIGFTHAVGDMAVVFVGMYNGAKVSVGEYIWKLLIPGAVGNIIGGSAFGIVIPFYLHLIVVERDNKGLGLPQYDLRDEQPEVNMDSRVVKVSKPTENLIDDELNEETDHSVRSDRTSIAANTDNETESVTSVDSELESTSYASQSTTDTPSIGIYHGETSSIRPKPSVRSVRTNMSKVAKIQTKVNSPAGLFPVYGMGEPLEREKTIQSGFRSASNQSVMDSVDRTTPRPPPSISHYTSAYSARQNIDEQGNNTTNVITNRPGARLEKAITRIVRAGNDTQPDDSLPITNQDLQNFEGNKEKDKKNHLHSITFH